MLAVAVLEKDPLPQLRIDPVEVCRVNRQSTLVLLARLSQDSQRKLLIFKVSCHAWGLCLGGPP